MAKEGDNNFGLLAVVFGILSLVFSLSMILGSFPGIIVGVIGLIFALIQRKRSKNKWAKWGMILSISGIIVGVILLVLFVSAIAEFANQMQELQASGALDSFQGGIPNA